jgi:hypothetical protein
MTLFRFQAVDRLFESGWTRLIMTPGAGTNDMRHFDVLEAGNCLPSPCIIFEHWHQPRTPTLSNKDTLDSLSDHVCNYLHGATMCKRDEPPLRG